jgi:hypothetical protein
MMDILPYYKQPGHTVNKDTLSSLIKAPLQASQPIAEQANQSGERSCPNTHITRKDHHETPVIKLCTY